MRIRNWILLTALLVFGCSDSDTNANSSTDFGQSDMGSDVSSDQNEPEDLGADATDAELGAGENEACEETSDCLNGLVCGAGDVCLKEQCALDCPELGSCEAGVVTIPAGGAWEGPCGEEPECLPPTTEDCTGACLSDLTETQKDQATQLARTGDLSAFCAP